MARGYLVVEGHGETTAALNLVVRLWNDLGLPPVHWADPPTRGLKLHLREGVTQACNLVRAKGDAEVLLILRDEDDGCPKSVGPTMSSWISQLNLNFPVALVLAHREYEVFFLPCLPTMAGRPVRDDRGVVRTTVVENAEFRGDPQSVRGVKELMRSFLTRGYKPTLDQLPLTRMIDFDVLRASRLPCFGTLENALRFLARTRGHAGTYPPPLAS